MQPANRSGGEMKRSEAVVDDIDRLEAQADLSFAALAGQAGLDTTRYRCVAQWVKDDVNRLHIVRHYEGRDVPAVVLKQAMRPEDVGDFAAIVDAHGEAQSVLAPVSGVTVPAILAKDLSVRAYLMAFQPGQTLLDLCRGTKDHAPHLRRAGRWLSAYHSGTYQEARVFQPKFMARHMLHLAGQMARGERRIKGQKRFIELAHLVQDHVADATGQPSKTAAKHGDLNAHNILISGHEVAAYDFLAKSRAPVGYDIARLLLSYAQTVGDIDSIPDGQAVPPDMMAAFFEGYDFVGPDDPGVRFLLRIQILTDWNRMNVRMTPKSLNRFRRLRAIARRAFA